MDYGITSVGELARVKQKFTYNEYNDLKQQLKKLGIKLGSFRKLLNSAEDFVKMR